MQVNTRLENRQELSQKRLLVPEMQQAVAILTLSAQELNQLIYKELEENPALEINENNEEKNDIFQQFYLNYTNSNETSKSIEYEDEIMPSHPQYYNQTLYEYLEQQLRLSKIPSRLMEVGSRIINSINEDGYLLENLEDISDDLDVLLSEIEEVLALIQTFDPPGIAARNLKECLLLQVAQISWENKDSLRDTVKEIIEKYLADLSSGKKLMIAKALNISVSQVQEAADFIHNLEPKPGRMFGGQSEVNYIIPEVYVQKVDDQYIINNNNSISPQLQVSPFYQQLLNNKNDLDKESYDFINNKIDSAFWLLKNIEQRRLTIQKIMEYILKYQMDFFEKGKMHLKALTLKQVADAIGVHESTVSRATTRKYVQTPQGIFELKYFFSNGFENNQDSNIAAETVKEIIKDIIQNEDLQQPFSDQQIVNILDKRNINISRRTVAKYREELLIPSAACRRKYL